MTIIINFDVIFIFLCVNEFYPCRDICTFIFKMENYAVHHRDTGACFVFIVGAFPPVTSSHNLICFTPCLEGIYRHVLCHLSVNFFFKQQCVKRKMDPYSHTHIYLTSGAQHLWLSVLYNTCSRIIIIIIIIIMVNINLNTYRAPLEVLI